MSALRLAFARLLSFRQSSPLSRFQPSGNYPPTKGTQRVAADHVFFDANSAFLKYFVKFGHNYFSRECRRFLLCCYNIKGKTTQSKKIVIVNHQRTSLSFTKASFESFSADVQSLSSISLYRLPRSSKKYDNNF